MERVDCRVHICAFVHIIEYWALWIWENLGLAQVFDRTLRKETKIFFAAIHFSYGAKRKGWNVLLPISLTSKSSVCCSHVYLLVELLACQIKTFFLLIIIRGRAKGEKRTCILTIVHIFCSMQALFTFLFSFPNFNTKKKSVVLTCETI